jgi:thymidylate kinase
MNNRSFLICFTGVDGSGKTTHAKYLKSHLEEQGYSCTYVWGGFRPFFAYFFFAFTRVLGYWKHTKKNAYTDPLEYAPRLFVKNFGKVWHLFIFIDYQLKALVKIRLPLLVGKVVICDRYFYDFLMELRLSHVSSKKFTFAISKGVPKPLVTFLMNIPETLAENRRNFSYEFFSKRNEVFLDLAKTFDFRVIDSSEPLLGNQRKIRQETLRRVQELASQG